MSKLKDVTIEAIRKLPDECSAEDVMYEINFVAQVMEGIKDAGSGRVLTTEQILSRIGQWADGRPECQRDFRLGHFRPVTTVLYQRTFQNTT